ncbi:Phytyl ester synthase 1, chloroplastic [Linum perenne]
MTSLVAFPLSLRLLKFSERKPKLQLKVRCSDSGTSSTSSSAAFSSDSFVVNGASSTRSKDEIDVLFNGGVGRNGRSSSSKRGKDPPITNYLDVLWDDGYGIKTIKDYLIEAEDMIKPDGGPPRWFCPVECGQPLTDSPILMFLPGTDGVGLGLVLHHKALGKVFEVRCLHIPVEDRTPFQGLVNFVEETLKSEHASSPNRPIYLVGDSFGGCLALAVAARNPQIDLVVILANPATSFSRSQIQPLLPLLEAIPNELHNIVPYLLSFVMGNPLKMAMVNVEDRLPPRGQMEQLSGNLTSLLGYLSGLSDIIPKETLAWKLKLIQSGAAYANSRLHAVKAEVLLLVSGQDNLLPSKDEAVRLKKVLQDCTVRYFKDNGHTLLMEEGLSLLTIIKGTTKYRRSRKVDLVTDYVPPSKTEFDRVFHKDGRLFQVAAGPVMLSTLEDGSIVKGLSGVPTEGPVLLVGYHMLMGLELNSLVGEYLNQKNVLLRGIAHPELFNGRFESSTTEFNFQDWIKVMGGVPVSASHFYKLLSTKSHVLLYPGGAREALHYKGEAHKVIWPEQQEFVRMAAKFGATIVPFGGVGEDDLVELVLDYKDLMNIPIINDYIREQARDAPRLRDEAKGEVANQELFIPGLLPKVPGRIYFLFGKPITTKGREDILRNKEEANNLYLQIKSDVEENIAYLLKNREKDPYRSVLDRMVHRALNPSSQEVPSFDLEQVLDT